MEKIVVNTSEESADFCGLLSGAVYTFNISAFNELGVSDPSDPLTVQTVQDVGEYTTVIIHNRIITCMHTFPFSSIIN